jgi:hypothetical protein
MTKKELIEQLSRLKDDDKVVILLKQPSVGSHAAAEIEKVSQGFDWDNGRIFLHTKEPVCSDKHLTQIQKRAYRYEKLLYFYALETNQMFMGKPMMASGMITKGTFARVAKEYMKEDVGEYLAPIQ